MLVLKGNAANGVDLKTLAAMSKFGAEAVYAAVSDGTLLQWRCHEGRWAVDLLSAGGSLMSVFSSEDDGFANMVQLKLEPAWILVGEDLHE